MLNNSRRLVFFLWVTAKRRIRCDEEKFFGNPEGPNGINPINYINCSHRFHTELLLVVRMLLVDKKKSCAKTMTKIQRRDGRRWMKMMQTLCCGWSQEDTDGCVSREGRSDTLTAQNRKTRWKPSLRLLRSTGTGCDKMLVQCGKEQRIQLPN